MKEHLFNRKTLAATLGTAAIGLAMGSSPLFAATDLGQGYQVTPSSTMQKVAQGSCGEGKCGGAAGEKTTDKSTEGKCGEGRCGS